MNNFESLSIIKNSITSLESWSSQNHTVSSTCFGDDFWAHLSLLVSLSHVSTTESASDTLQVYLYWNNALELVVIRNGEQKTYKLETDSVVDFFEKLEDLKPIFQGSWNKNEKRGVYSMGFEFDGARYVIQGTVQY